MAISVRIAFLLVGLLPPACSRHPLPPAAAKVNGKDISIQHFKQALAQSNFSATARPDPARLMDGMIDRELLAQQAVKIKLDRNAFVVQAIDGARTGILAQAYLEHSLAWAPDEARGEVQSFYRDNPALFAQRRIYRVFELAAIAPEDQVAAIKERASRAEGLQELADWLKSRNLAFNVGGVTKSTEHIAPDLLRRLSTMKDGQIAVIEVPGGASIIQLVQSESAPLSQEQAAPMIEQLLRVRKQAEVAEREIKALRSSASIQYVVDLGSHATQQASAPASSAIPLPPSGP